MSEPIYGRTFGGGAAENYDRYFVPTIGRPIAEDLVAAASLRLEERVLDVGCGTGVVARLAADRVGGGFVAGLDVNPAMLAVALKRAAHEAEIDWYEASADAMPLPDDAFDVVLSQMSLQFMDDRIGALREMRRVLAPGGRLVLNVPSPTPPLFGAFAEGLANHIDAQMAGFVLHVFSVDHETLRALTEEAGFKDVAVSYAMKPLRLPRAEEFLWQYIHSTPMGAAVTERDEATLRALQQDICALWDEFAVDDGMEIEVGIATAVCRQ